MELCGVVILYLPNKEVIQNINSYINNFELLILIDNSPTLSPEISAFIKKTPSIKLLHNGNNDGIAKRLNEAVKIAIQLGFSHMLTMDQDSFFGDNIFSKYKENATALFKANESKVAMVGVNHEENIIDLNSQDIIEVQFLITSGCILSLNVAVAIGYFDESLFIDEVDTEYCYRAITNGYRIIKLNHICMQHQIGDISFKRSLKNGELTKRSLHSPIRIYYIVRNYLYVNKKYKSKFTIERARVRKGVFVSLKNNLLYSNERIKVVANIFSAIKDFLNNKMYKKNDS